MNRSSLAVVLLLVCGCATQPKITREEIEAADCGPFPKNYKELIIAKVNPLLRDPASAQYRFTEPVKGANFKPAFYGGGLDRFGWIVEYWVNAKNAFGGYSGERHHTVIIRDGEVKGLITSEEVDRMMDGRGTGLADSPYAR